MKPAIRQELRLILRCFYKINMRLIEKNISCVIIDDEINSCYRLQELLEKIPGVSVIDCETNGDDGIKTVIKSGPDIVFIDVEMPAYNGFDIIKKIRAKNVTPCFVIVTAYSQYAIKAIKNETFDYLLKPVDIDELRDTISRFKTEQTKKLELIVPEKLKSMYSLTDREIEIVTLLLKGKTSKQIAELLFISIHTVSTHRRKILFKTGSNSTSDLLSIIQSF